MRYLVNRFKVGPYYIVIACNYPGVVIYQTQPVTEIQVFYPVYTECSLFNTSGGDSTRILS